MTALLHLLRRVNLRNAQEHRLRTTLTIIGIAAGVALLASTSIINSTALDAISSNEAAIARGASLEVASADLTGLPEEAEDAVAAVDGVAAVAPLLRTTTRVNAGGAPEARVLVLGVSAQFRDVFAGGEPAIEGGFGEDARGLVPSARLAAALGVEPGDRVSVATPAGPRTVAVTGVLTDERAAGINAGDIALMRIGAAQFVFERPGRVDTLAVLAREGMPLPALRDRIDEALGGAAVVGEPNRRGEALETTFDALSMLRGVTGAISLMVALFIVFMTMSMSIQERRRQLSTALAIGSTRRQLLGAFLVEGLVVGSAGTALGIGGGVLLGKALAQQAIGALTFLPVVAGGHVDVGARSIALWAAAGIAIALAGALVPARRILHVAPVEALRPEAHYEWEPEAGGRGRRINTASGAVLFVFGVAGLLLVGRYPEEPALAIAAVLLLIGGLTMLLPWIVPLAVGLMRPVMIRLFGTTGRLAADGLRKNPARMALTVGALVLTAGTVVGVGAATHSYERQFLRLADGWFGMPLYVTTGSNTGIRSDQPMLPEAREVIASVPGVAGAYPIRYNFSTVGDGLALVVGTPVAATLDGGPRVVTEFAGGDSERAIAGLARGQAVISHYTADRLGIGPGDTLRMPTPTGERGFTVAETFEDLSTLYTVYLDQETYARAWNDPLVDRYAVALDDGASPDAVAARIDEALAAAGVDAATQTRAGLIMLVLGLYRQLISLARGIQIAALVIAALAIANTMFTTVLERRWEFGLQRALGMDRRQIGRIVLIEAGSIGLLGGVLAGITGTSLGYVALQAEQAAYSLVIPFAMPTAVVAVVVAGGAAVAAVAGLYPRRLAVQPTIIETLRFE